MCAYVKPVIVTDSCGDLLESFYQEHEIHVVPLSYTIDAGETIKDLGGEKSALVLFSQLRAGKTSATSQANVYDFIEKFTAIIQDQKAKGESRPILYLGFSSALSGTYSSGTIAAGEIKNQYPQVEITTIDSLAASMGQGLLLYYVTEMIQKETPFADICSWLLENRLRVNHWFTVDDLNHLKRGGRLSASAAFVGTMLSIKPILWVNKDGSLKPTSKERGRKKALHALYEKFATLAEQPDGQMVYISHGDCYEDALIVKNMILENFKVKDVVINYIGSVIGTHAGPGTIALFFMGKARA